MSSRILNAAIVLAGLMATAPASAQLIDSGTNNTQASWNTASSSTMNLRSPGRLVKQARSNYSELHSATIIRSRFGPTITEAKPDLTLEQQVRIQNINTLFTNLNTALAAYNVFLRASAGLPATGDTTTSGLFDLLGLISSPSS